jgi:hypothetical protein
MDGHHGPQHLEGEGDLMADSGLMDGDQMPRSADQTAGLTDWLIKFGQTGGEQPERYGDRDGQEDGDAAAEGFGDVMDFAMAGLVDESDPDGEFSNGGRQPE